jgi:cell wall-associated NlpC family hydrolase
MPYGVTIPRVRVTRMIAQPARIFGIFALAITMLGLTSACSSTPRTGYSAGTPGGTVNVAGSVGETAAAIALDQVGIPYRFGGTGPGGFDCSGLVQYSYSRAGKRLPRTTKQLWTSTEAVGKRELRIGDVLFFSIEGKMSHVGLYLGQRRFVHAPASGRAVSVASLDSPYYRTAFLRGGRPR